MNKPLPPLHILWTYLKTQHGVDIAANAQEVYAAAARRYARHIRWYAAEQQVAAAEQSQYFPSAEAKQRVIANRRAKADLARATYDASMNEAL